jgi:hypothetical protein
MVRCVLGMSCNKKDEIDSMVLEVLAFASPPGMETTIAHGRDSCSVLGSSCPRQH